MKRLVIVLFLVCAAVSACSTPEDPARVALRARIKDPAPMSFDEIGQMFDEVSKTIEGKTVRGVLDGMPHDIEATQKDVVIGMLTYRPGVFDEGVRTVSGKTVRVINAPGRPSNAELDAARHIMIDVETFLPTHFEFTSGVASDEFTLDLVVQP